VTPLSWPDVPSGSYLLRFAKKGRAPVTYPLRLDRELFPEALHELAVRAGRDETFAEALAREKERLSGSAPAERHVRVALPEAAKVPDGFVVVPAGSFLMGEEKTPVYLESYLASVTELSVGEWMEYLEEAGTRKRTPMSNQGLESQAQLVWELIVHTPDPERLPAATLSWDDARAYMRWKNVKERKARGGDGAPLRTLPTAAMWEKAARGVDGRTFPWGDIYVGTRLNGVDLRPVRKGRDVFVENYDPVDLDRGTSVFGLKHVSGNVWEWCLNATDRSSGMMIVKGGGFTDEASRTRLAGRFTVSPNGRYHNIGFRVFIPLP
jgi:serine/threonine-protein kinase